MTPSLDGRPVVDAAALATSVASTRSGPPTPPPAPCRGPARRRVPPGAGAPAGRVGELDLPHGSLGAVFDHVALAVSDLAASERFYRTVLATLGVEPSHADADLVEWEDFDIGVTDAEHPVSRGLHVGFARRPGARRRVLAGRRRGGHPDDGAPGPRTVYGPRTTAASCSTRTATASRPSTRTRDRGPDGRIDHLWLRVRDPQASRRFYATIAPHAGLRVVHDTPTVVRLAGSDSFARP